MRILKRITLLIISTTILLIITIKQFRNKPPHLHFDSLEINHFCDYITIDTFNEISMKYYNESLNSIENQVNGCRQGDMLLIYNVTDITQGSDIYKEMVEDEMFPFYSNVDYHKITLNLQNLFNVDKNGKKYHTVCPSCRYPDEMSSILCWTQRIDKTINEPETWNWIPNTYKEFKIKENNLFEIIVERYGFYPVKCTFENKTYYYTLINIFPVNMSILREETIHMRNYVDQIKRNLFIFIY
jgi:hypothetical protein